MAVRNLLKGFGAQAEDLTSNGLRSAVLDDFEQTGIAWIWASDADGHLSYLSSAAAEALDIAMPTLLGQPVATLFETDPNTGAAWTKAGVDAAQFGFEVTV